MNYKQVELGDKNLEAVRIFFGEHLCATQNECARVLGLSVMAVNRHVKEIRKEWRINSDLRAIRSPLLRDLTGLKFSRLTVISRADDIDTPVWKQRKPKWYCKCECGKHITTFGSWLTSGRSASCGCIRRERLREALTTHGMSQTSTYQTWASIVSRYLMNGKRRKGKPAICKEWRTFQGFYDDMGSKPTARHRLKRLDERQGFKLSNCKWIKIGKKP